MRMLTIEQCFEFLTFVAIEFAVHKTITPRAAQDEDAVEWAIYNDDGFIGPFNGLNSLQRGLNEMINHWVDSDYEHRCGDLKHFKEKFGILDKSVEVPALTKLKNVHPGEVLAHEFMIPLEISLGELLDFTSTEKNLLMNILLRRGRITEEIDLKLSKKFGTSKGYWLGLQADFDKEEVDTKKTT